MKRNKLIYIFLILTAISFLYFCNYSKYRRYKFFLDPVYSPCETLNDSKEVGVFIEEYVPVKRKIKILNQEININHVWIEYCWQPSKFYYIPDTIYKDCKNLIFNLNEEIINYNEENGFFIENIFINEDVKSVAYTLRKYSILNIGNIKNLDTIILPVYKGEYDFEKDNYKKIEELIFVKKSLNN